MLQSRTVHSRTRRPLVLFSPSCARGALRKLTYFSLATRGSKIDNLCKPKQSDGDESNLDPVCQPLAEPITATGLVDRQVSNVVDSDIESVDTFASALTDEVAQSVSDTLETNSERDLELGKLTLKKKRLTTSQKKKLRILMAGGEPYESALEKVLSDHSPTVDASKRRRSNSPVIPNKRTKSSVPLYKDVATGIIKVGIIPEGFPVTQLDSAKQKAVASAITGLLYEEPMDGPQIRFLGCSFKPGWVTMNCADVVSRDWLMANISRVSPWENAKLLTVEGDNLPKPCVATAYFPGTGRTPENILRMLVRQNKDLSTKDWKVLRKVENSQGLALTLAMDECSVKQLENLNCLPFFELNRVQFRIVKRNHSTPSLARASATLTSKTKESGKPIPVVKKDKPIPPSNTPKLSHSKTPLQTQPIPSTSSLPSTSVFSLPSTSKQARSEAGKTASSRPAKHTKGPQKGFELRQSLLSGSFPSLGASSSRAIQQRGRGGKRGDSHTKVPSHKQQ